MSHATNRATMCAIAKRAGVSRTTVSYVVNGQADRRNISLRTRERVIGIMQEMNYRPDIMAQALQGVRTRTIGVLWSLTGYNPITAMVNEIALMAKRHNHASYLADHLNDPDATVNALDDFASRRVDAVVIDADAVLLRDKRIIKALGQFAAAVAISPEPVEATVDLIVHERGTLYLQAAQHLLNHDRTRLAVAMPKVPNHEPKIRAIQRAIAQHPGPTEPLLEIRYQIDYPKVEHSAQYILAALQQQFPGEVPFDALLCPSDQEAAYAIRWLQEKGLEIPRDVAVVGANNTEFGRLVTPPLATGIRHDEAVAAEIERMLFGRLESPTSALQTSTVDMEFVWRQSAGN
jgi:DNA-binding LacI/PurR family transcriptional regulator